MFRIEAGRGHWGLEVEAQPFLDSNFLAPPRTLGKVEKQDKVEHDGCGQDRVAAEEVDFDLHGIAEPSKNVDVVPAFFIIATRRVVVNPNSVEDVSIQLRVKFGLQD